MRICATFVHGYQDLEIKLEDSPRPALVICGPDSHEIHSYPFPRNPSDFHSYSHLISGEEPLVHAENFKKLPRFGLTGLTEAGGQLFAGSWNGIYKISKSTYELESIVSHRLMSDLHGIYADENEVISLLTAKDTVVISDHEGRIKEHFSILRNLDIVTDPGLESVDWRFISKQLRGTAGFWHFNFVEKEGDLLFLTSRNASAIVEVDLKRRRAQMRLMDLCTPTLLHDGCRENGSVYFTSIDGKIIIAKEHRGADERQKQREDPGNLDLYNRDLEVELIRLEETDYGKEPNWCRGLCVNGENVYVTIDGRYGEDLSFGILGLSTTGHNVVMNHRVKWAEIGDSEGLKYVTGFDLIALD